LSSRLSQHFNEAIQCDLLFVYDYIVLHVIDECLRFSAGQVVPDKQTETLLSALVSCWLRLYGPPGVIISDKEGSLFSEQCSIWAERWGTSMRYKARGSHAFIVERHNELLRQQIHGTQEQLNLEGITVPFADVVGESIFAKNALLNVGGSSPYTGLYGRVPAPLSDFESPNVSQAIDDDALLPGTSKHSVRLREIAVAQMVSATARE
jgi:hypothetical protein